MNQERIGKFIAECRKNKGLTQSELSEQLGVTDRSVSNWENGKNMPDLSLFKPLCEILNITINELLSGERLNKETYQEKFEENIVNTINYTNKKIKAKNNILGIVLLVFGFLIVLTAMIIFESESSWGSIYSVLGTIISFIGFAKLIKKFRYLKRIILLFVFLVLFIAILLFADYVSVRTNEKAPIFRIKTTTINNVIYYDTLFYDVYRCNFDEDNEYWIIDKNSKPSVDYLINYCK